MRFLYFCKEYDVKIVFWGRSRAPKSTPKSVKIGPETEPEECAQIYDENDAQKLPKFAPNGPPNRARNESKGGPRGVSISDRAPDPPSHPRPPPRGVGGGRPPQKEAKMIPNSTKMTWVPNLISITSDLCWD